MIKYKATIASLAAVVTLVGCKATLVPYEIEPGYARVQNFTPTAKYNVKVHKEWEEQNIDENTYPYTKESVKFLYVMCNNYTPRGFRLAYQHPAGDHKLWIKAIFKDREADVLFNINLKAGGDYGLAHRMYKNRRQVEVWIKDNVTGKQISETQVITLKKMKVEYTKAYDLWQSRCSQGSV